MYRCETDWSCDHFKVNGRCEKRFTESFILFFWNFSISDMIFPIGDVKLTDDDFIPLRRGGTGFASANQELKAKLYRPAMQC